jgi:hypothetical protein
MSCKRPVALAVILGFLAIPGSHALDVPLTPEQMERALRLARWPTTDRERTEFHARYVIAVTARQPNFFTIDQIAIITEFRRLELIAEDHARLNDLFGRGGLQDAERALRPFRNQVRIAARLHFAPNAFVVGVPPVEIRLDAPPLPPLDVRTSPTHNGPLLVGRTCSFGTSSDRG